MELKLNGVFKNGGILQRDADIRIFGLCKPGATVTCSLIGEDNSTVTTGKEVANEDGTFLVTMPPVEAGGPFSLKVTGNREKILLNDVYTGDVFIAGGQSNMEMPLSRTEFGTEDGSRCKDTLVRYYKVPACALLDESQESAEAASQWIDLTSDTAGQMSGVAFYFSGEIRKYLSAHGQENVRVGIVECFLGGTSVSCWQSKEKLFSYKEGRMILNDFNERIKGKTNAEYLRELIEYDDSVKKWNSRVEAFTDGRPYASQNEIVEFAGECPWPPPEGEFSLRRPGGLFETMVKRIAPYSVKNVIFYQGEEDCDDYAKEYYSLFASMIEEWRSVFQKEDLFFVFAQLPMYISRDRKYMGFEDYKWPVLRQKQYEVSKDVPNTAMVVLADCGEFDNVHPIDKKTPGTRLALLTEKKVYLDDSISAVSPYVVDIRHGSLGVEISFSGDMHMLLLRTDDENGFEIAGDDDKFYEATASVGFDGRTVTVSSNLVETPRSVRYAYFSYGQAQLFSETGLPAVPFEMRIQRNLIGN